MKVNTQKVSSLKKAVALALVGLVLAILAFTLGRPAFASPHVAADKQAGAVALMFAILAVLAIGPAVQRVRAVGRVSSTTE